MRIKVDVVLPVYREDHEVLRSVVARIRAAVPAARIILVDDGNPAVEGRSFAAMADRVVRHEVNRGYVHAIRSGFAAALGETTCDVVLKLDADGQYPPERIPSLLQAFTGDVDVVSGSRYHKDSTTHRGYPEREGINRIVAGELALRGVEVGDPFTGFRAFSRSALELLLPLMGKHICRYGYGLSIETTLNIHLLGLRHVEVPCELHYPTLKQFPGEMSNPEWRLRYYRAMIDAMLSSDRPHHAGLGHLHSALDTSRDLAHV